jgi:hypothetical protein
MIYGQTNFAADPFTFSLSTERKKNEKLDKVIQNRGCGFFGIYQA